MPFVIDYDQDADFSWLEQDEFKDEDPRDHIALEVVLYDDAGVVIDSLCGIDFIEARDDWTTGCFDSVEDIPARCEYLREIAQMMADIVARREARRYLDLL
jgi:hypothetical protein